MPRGNGITLRPDKCSAHFRSGSSSWHYIFGFRSKLHKVIGPASGRARDVNIVSRDRHIPIETVVKSENKSENNFNTWYIGVATIL